MGGLVYNLVFESTLINDNTDPMKIVTLSP